MPEGHQSPPPERQTGAQLQDPPSDGQGVDNAAGKAKANEEQLKNLESNPKGAVDDALKEKFSKSH